MTNHDYPLVVDDRRTYAPDYSGRVYVWDIDKTYLDTHFSSLKGLLRIPIEFGVDKESIRGMSDVLISLRRGASGSAQCHPLYFISASPSQIQPVIERKMVLDGVEYDGFCFKDWLGVITGRRWGRFLDQLGFKVCALLKGRLSRPHSREVLFGDDYEQDIEAFCLYARLINEKLSAGDAEVALEEAGMPAFDRKCAHDLLDQLEAQDGQVEHIFIHMVSGESESNPRLDKASDLVTPFDNAKDLSAHLRRLGMIR